MTRKRYPTLMLSMLLATGVAACDRGAERANAVDALDNQLLGNDQRDPAVEAALNDPIATDPALTDQSNADAVRPGRMPASQRVPGDIEIAGEARAAMAEAEAALGGKPAAAPEAKPCEDCGDTGAVTLGQLADRQQGRTRTASAGGGCGAKLNYSAHWANRLPDGLTLYPRAHVVEAAGSDDRQCGLRVVSFTSAAPLSAITDYYYARTRRAGYSAEHQHDGDCHVLGGTRGNSAYVLFIKPKAGGGTTVDMVISGGR